MSRNFDRLMLADMDPNDKRAPAKRPGRPHGARSKAKALRCLWASTERERYGAQVRELFMLEALFKQAGGPRSSRPTTSSAGRPL